jgi:putative nucleotidyltransferase with HDIG domain
MIDPKTQIKLDRYIQNMPPLPVTVSKILEVTKNPNVDAKELNNVISLDPVLTGRVLKLINSAYYSLPNQITSIVRAIVMLGINTVKNLAISTSVLSSVKDKKNFNALDMDGFWRHSICVGVMAKTFAKIQRIDSKKIEEYFVAGLLHDIGKIPLNSTFPEIYIQAMNYSQQTKTPLYLAETKFFSINHAELGFQIAKLWKLNPLLFSSICFHHTFEEVDENAKKFVATIALANIITNKIGIGFSGNKYPEEREEEIFKITGHTWDDISQAEESATEAIKKAEIFLQLN